MMTLSLKNINGEMRDAVTEVAADLCFSLLDGGIELRLDKGEKNSCKLKSGIYTVTYAAKNYVFRALKNLLESGGRDFEREETCMFSEFGAMADCSRNAVLSVFGAKKLIRVLATAGYNMLQLYTEDTYEVKNEPFFGYLRGRYSAEELKELDAYAAKFGIELVPCIQTLAHIAAIKKWWVYTDIFDCDDILLAKEERTYELIDNMFSSLRDCFTSRKINIGMDEAHMVGLGKYLDKHGYQNRFDIITAHLNRVLEIAAKYGFTCSMWSDMFFRLAFNGEYAKDGQELPEEIKAKIPAGIELIYWDYYASDTPHYDHMLTQHEKIGNEMIFAGGFWKWIGFAPHNHYSLETTSAALAALKKHNTKRAFFTMWGDFGGEASPFMCLPPICYTAEYAYGNEKMPKIKRSFEALAGISWDAFMALDLPNGEYKANEILKNPSRYMLYSDVFTGFFDTTVVDGGNLRYKQFARKLSSHCRHERWGYLFRHLKKLCDTLSYKYELGVKTRALYEQSDREGIKKLIETDYKPFLKSFNAFYNEFLAYWNTDNKPHGFDIQDLRLGGVMLRVRHCMDVLSSYASGKLENIAELDEKLINFQDGSSEFTKGDISCNTFTYIASVNPI